MRRFTPVKTRSEPGQVLLGIVVVFTSIVTIVVLGVTAPILRRVQIANDTSSAMQSYLAGESLAEDLAYRFMNGMKTSVSESLTVASSTASATVTSNLGVQTITSIGTDNSLERSISLILTEGTGIAFNYGIQTGNGGFVLHNNASVIGNVYVNGNITGSTNTSVTGTAVAANSIALVADQINNTPSVPTASVKFADAVATQDFAQSFQVSATAPANSIGLYIKKTGAPADITVRITADDNGNPAASSITSATLPASLVGTSYGWATTTFPTGITLNAGTTYWIVLDAASNASKYYNIAANSAYATGTAKIGQYGSTWSNTSPSGLDGYFQFAVGGLTSTIDRVIVGQAGVGDAWAHTITNSVIADHNYCQTGSGNKKTCDTSKIDPTPEPYPVSDANIAAWKAAAAAGTIISGDVTISTTTTLGPAKITGNLIIDKTLILSGVVWVVGNISTTNNVTVKLDPSFGASGTVILSDGYADLRNGATFQGTGSTGSYIMLLTTSDCPASVYCSGKNAIEIGNNAGTVILNAQKGTVHINNNAGANAITANKVELDNNATVTYVTGLASSLFKTGPAGGYVLNDWTETE